MPFVRLNRDKLPYLNRGDARIRCPLRETVRAVSGGGTCATPSHHEVAGETRAGTAAPGGERSGLSSRPRLQKAALLSVGGERGI